MTRKARLTRLEAAQGEKIGPEDVIGFYFPDLERGVYVDQYGRTIPMTEAERLDAEAARAYLERPISEDEDDEDPPRVTFNFQIAPVTGAGKRR